MHDKNPGDKKRVDEGGEKIKSRFSNIPAPAQLNRRNVGDKNWDGFEDAALDSTLETMGSARSDGLDFLERVRAKVKSPKPKTPETEETFFGMGTSLLPEAESIQNEKAPASIEKASSHPLNRKRLVKVISAIAAAIVCLVAGAIYFSSTNSGNSDRAANQPNLLVEDSNIEKVAAETGIPGKANSVPAASNTPATDLVANDSKPPSIPPSILKPDSNKIEFDKVATKPKEKTPMLTGPPENSVWSLELEFDDQWNGTFAVNGKQLESKVNNRNADAVLKKIGHEVARRVHFVSPIFDPDWIGEIVINGPDLKFRQHFDGIDQMFDCVLDLSLIHI